MTTKHATNTRILKYVRTSYIWDQIAFAAPLLSELDLCQQLELERCLDVYVDGLYSTPSPRPPVITISICALLLYTLLQIGLCAVDAICKHSLEQNFVPQMHTCGFFFTFLTLPGFRIVVLRDKCI